MKREINKARGGEMSVSIYVFLWDVSQRLLLMAKKPIRSRIRSPIPIWKILRCLCSGCQIAVRNFRGISPVPRLQERGCWSHGTGGDEW